MKYIIWILRRVYINLEMFLEHHDYDWMQTIHPIGLIYKQAAHRYWKNKNYCKDISGIYEDPDPDFWCFATWCKKSNHKWNQKLNSNR